MKLQPGNNIHRYTHILILQYVDDRATCIQLLETHSYTLLLFFPFQIFPIDARFGYEHIQVRSKDSKHYHCNIINVNKNTNDQYKCFCLLCKKNKRLYCSV